MFMIWSTYNNKIMDQIWEKKKQIYLDVSASVFICVSFSSQPISHGSCMHKRILKNWTFTWALHAAVYEKCVAKCVRVCARVSSLLVLGALL